MVLVPTRTKYRKMQKGSMSGLSTSGNFVDFGDFGMQALDRGRITQNEIEACRVAINRFFNRRGKVWIRIFPDKSISKKPAETRMGKGKGAPDHWAAVVRPGRILFEVGGVPKPLAQEALKRGAAKLRVRTRFVERMERV
jgi:large subunit ribosomal protein L16